jgi:hypothetical protein
MEEVVLNSDILIHYFAQRQVVDTKRREQATAVMERIRLMFALTADRCRLTTNL